MSLLPRALQKIFGSTGSVGEFGKIGSKAAGVPVTTKDLELMQALTEYDLGLPAIISDQGTSVLPYLEDINSLFFLTTSQIAYLMQSGIPEWNDETEYYLDVSLVLDGGIIYKDTFGTGGTPNLNFQPSANPDKWEAVLGSKKVEFETSRDLATNFISVTQARATFSRMSLLDSNNIPKYLNNQSLTWTMPGDLEAGQSEEASTDYGCWVDSVGILKLVADIESVTDGVTAGFLDDSANTFATRLVKAGDAIYNLDDRLKTTVKTTATVDGDPLELNDDIFTSSPKNYKIVKMSPEGLGENRERIFAVFNNSGSDFDDSWYTQIQEEKKYNGDGSDFDVTSVPAISSLVRANTRITQSNDWTGKGTWESELRATYNVASASRSLVTMSVTGIVNKNLTNFSQVISASPNTTSLTINKVTALTNSGDYTLSHSAGNTTVYFWYCKVELEKKPPFHN